VVSVGEPSQGGGNPRPRATSQPQSASSSGATSEATLPRRRAGAEGELVRLGLRFYDAGFNVVPVDGKRPLTSWGHDRRIERGRLEELLGRASGVAVVGGPENPLRPFHLVLVDVDRPSALERYPTLRELVSKTVVWRTGPRCPRCEGKELEVLELGRRFRCSKCGTEFGIEKAKRGLGLLVGAEAGAVERYLGGTVRGGDVELLVKNYQLVPPSRHPTGVEYEWVRPPDFRSPNYGIYTLTPTELEVLLRELGALREPAEVGTKARGRPEGAGGGLRELSDGDILKVKDLLEDAYRPGVRQYVWLFLSGWGAKAGVSPVSIARILKMLYEESGDTDPIRTRASAIVYSYRKAGVDLEPYAAEFEAVLGVKPYGLEREIREEEVKGRTGLQEILEEVLGEERALEVIKELSEVFQAASPFRDSIIEILDYERQLYAVANLRKLVVVRARRNENKLVYKERVVVGAPTEVVVYVNPIGGVTKYQVRWETATRPRPLVVGPCLLEEIIDRLRAEGLVLHSRLVNDIIPAIVEGFVRRGKAEVRTEVESPGFYYLGGRVVGVKVDARTPTKEELREALELLNELASKWFKHVQDRFSEVVRWGVVAPFTYCYKQRGKWVRWLYLWGPSKTGKTTLGDIVLRMWGLDSRNVKTGASIDTPARLGYVLSQTTFPVLVNEPANALGKDEIVEMVKNAVESLIVRGKYQRGSYIDIPALAPIIFTSNRYIPRDDALLRRFKVLTFTYGEKIPEEKAVEFESTVKPRLGKLKAIGDYIARRIVGNDLPENPEDVVKILEEAYGEAGLEVPEWLGLRHEEVEDYAQDQREAVRVFLVERVNEEFSRFVGKVLVEKPEGVEAVPRTDIDLGERVRIVVDKQLIPWIIKRVEGGEEYLYITTGIMKELAGVVGGTESLKSLAELLGWEYDPRWSVRESSRVTSKSVIRVSLKDFIDFLTLRES
jgi:hypothetical protein